MKDIYCNFGVLPGEKIRKSSCQLDNLGNYTQVPGYKSHPDGMNNRNKKPKTTCLARGKMKFQSTGEFSDKNPKFAKLEANYIERSCFLGKYKQTM